MKLKKKSKIFHKGGILFTIYLFGSGGNWWSTYVYYQHGIFTKMESR